MVGSSSPMQQALLVAPGVKGRKVLPFKLRENDALLRSIIAAGSGSVRSAFYVLDLGRVVDLYRSWCRALPGVRPFYAVKCNTDPALLGALASLGAGFDCASPREMESVLALGADSGSILYANPCKPEAHLEYAARLGLKLTTYDTEAEVAKVKRCHPECELLLRIKGPDNGDAKVDLGRKYGARADEVVPLLRAAQRAGLPVAGVSFHVGSGGTRTRTDVYRLAIQSARAAFDAAAALGMPPMRVLDIGGGFVAGAVFEEAAAVVRGALADHFGDLLRRVEVVGEPGTYYAETAFTLAVRVIGKRARGEARDYWIDDGVFGSLSGPIYGFVRRPRPLAALVAGEKTYASTVFGPTLDSFDMVVADEKTYASTVFGPTLDSFDMVVAGYPLPEMSVGDWLVFDDMGAYTTALASNFNGFSMSDITTFLAYSS